MDFPNEQQIATVMEFTGCDDRQIIITALKAKSGNTESVVAEYFEDDVKFRSKYNSVWDDSLFNAGRDGEPQVPSFNIHPPENENNYDPQASDTSKYFPGAPSRPPSRTNNRSPLSSVVGASMPPPYQALTGAPVNKEQEDADLRRALQESLGTSGMQTPQIQVAQESGVMDTDVNEVHFGPAQRPDYDEGEWAMIQLNKAKIEPPPSERTRKPDTPAFLVTRAVNAWARPRFGAILTVLHSIPRARNALLSAGRPPETGYGHNANWWKGELVLSPHVEDHGRAWGQMPCWNDELHRLVAFLDMTDRSYATSDTLANVLGNLEEELFEKLRTSESCEGKDDNSDSVAPLFCQANVISVMTEEIWYSHAWGLLQIELSTENLSIAETLNDVWDMLFFMDIVEEQVTEAKTALLSNVGEVLTMRFADALPKMLEIPETFYVDRYLASNRDRMREVQFDMRAINRAINKSKKLERDLITWTCLETGAIRNRKEVNPLAVSRCQDMIDLIKSAAAWRRREEYRALGVDGHYLPDRQDEPRLSFEEVQRVQRLEERIGALESEMRTIDEILQNVIMPERKQLKNMLRHLANLYTSASQDAAWIPQHGYQCRGLIKEANTIYINIPPEPDLMELDNDSVSSCRGQWWKLAYLEEGDKKVETMKSSFEEAVRGSCGAGSNPLMIYATAAAVKTNRVPLSEALRTFVKHDNRLFKLEREQEREQQTSTEDNQLPAQRARSNSLGSMDTNRASRGSRGSDDGFPIAGGERGEPHGGFGFGEDTMRPQADMGSEFEELVPEMRERSSTPFFALSDTMKPSSNHTMNPFFVEGNDAPMSAANDGEDH